MSWLSYIVVVVKRSASHGQRAATPLPISVMLNQSKKHLLGNPAALVPPAWRHQHTQRSEDSGSRILITKLPPDVAEPEIEVLNISSCKPATSTFLSGALQKDSWSAQGLLYCIQLSRSLKGYGCRLVPPLSGRGNSPTEIQWYLTHPSSLVFTYSLSLLQVKSSTVVRTLAFWFSTISFTSFVHVYAGRPIKIEIVVDGFPPIQPSPPPATQSLLDRIGATRPTTAPPKPIPNGTPSQ